MNKQKRIIFTKLSVKESQELKGGYEPLTISSLYAPLPVPGVSTGTSAAASDRNPGTLCRD